jgi:TRAP-type C4-dicarboxylate transport system permease small subunit
MDSIFIRRLTWIVERILIVLSVSITAVVFLQVVFRYVLRQPLFWSEELPRYLLIWISFLAAALAQKHEAHINITLLVTRLSPRLQQARRILANLVMLGFLGVLVYSGSLVASITAHHRSTALQIPMALVYLALPVGSALMILYLILQIARDLRNLSA